ncbi:hypothetical protein EVAR_77519_1 [Eumeta japonica]|uniref:Uncharacterized protein n=1 Tax=Eumeta variegata TaxID=151549 RepID=A0A4C1T9W5_EUMVA|nr:hypothetical protein EVAR_77519_1 [Eumeta japonica]
MKLNKDDRFEVTTQKLPTQLYSNQTRNGAPAQCTGRRAAAAAYEGAGEGGRRVLEKFFNNTARAAARGARVASAPPRRGLSQLETRSADLDLILYSCSLKRLRSPPKKPRDVRSNETSQAAADKNNNSGIDSLRRFRLSCARRRSVVARIVLRRRERTPSRGRSGGLKPSIPPSRPGTSRSQRSSIQSDST